MLESTHTVASRQSLYAFAIHPGGDHWTAEARGKVNINCLLRLLWFSLTLAGGISISSHAAQAEVLVLLSAPGAAYRDAGNALSAELAARRPGARVEIRQLSARPALSGYAAVAAIGSGASRFVLDASEPPPAVHALVPASSFLAVPAASRRGHTAVFIDQPAKRQIALIRGALPQWQRLALLHGKSSAELADRLADAARASGMEVSSSGISDRADLYSAIQIVLSEPAVLLALPDASVFNSYTAQNILLSAYRQNSPVVGFSPAYVRAGALMALYTSPAAIGRQAAALVASVLAGDALPRPQYPSIFRVSVNDRVARSLNIGLPSASALTELLRKQEPSE